MPGKCRSLRGRVGEAVGERRGPTKAIRPGGPWGCCSPYFQGSCVGCMARGPGVRSFRVGPTCQLG